VRCRVRLLAAPAGISLRPMPPGAAAPRSPRRSLGLAVASLLLVLAGVVGYFVVVFRAAAWLPAVRNDAVPNWILVALGVGLAALAMRRAPAPDFALPNQAGKTVRLSGLRGAPVLLVFYRGHW